MDSKLFSGTLEMLILEVISASPNYGYEIAQQVVNRSGKRFDYFNLSPGLLPFPLKTFNTRIRSQGFIRMSQSSSKRFSSTFFRVLSGSKIRPFMAI